MEGKDLLATRRFWGVVVALFAPLLMRYFQMSPANLEGLAEALGAAVGIGITIWGYFARDKSRPITTAGGLPLKDSSNLGLVLAIALLISLSACVSAPRTPQQAINNVNMALTAGYEQVADNVRIGAMTDQERTSAIAKLDELSKKADEAQRFLDLGDITKVETQLKLLQAALPELQRRLAAKARTKP